MGEKVFNMMRLLTFNNKYDDIFNQSLNEFGCTHLLKMFIQERTHNMSVS